MGCGPGHETDLPQAGLSDGESSFAPQTVCSLANRPGSALNQYRLPKQGSLVSADTAIIMNTVSSLETVFRINVQNCQPGGPSEKLVLSMAVFMCSKAKR